MSNPNAPEEQDKVHQLIEKSKPILKKFTFSSLMGYCGGLTAKKFTKAAAVVIGVAFFGLQGLAYKGLIDIDWKKVQSSAVSAVDTVRFNADPSYVAGFAASVMPFLNVCS
jgi:uncharacterized membrane protein (Fun14 family)